MRRLAHHRTSYPPLLASPALPRPPATQTLLLQNKFDWGEYAQDGRLLLRCARACCRAAPGGCGVWRPRQQAGEWGSPAPPAPHHTAPAPCVPASRSYGPCQFPTLGLIVQRAWEIQAHIPEDFWYIQARPD